MKRQFVVTVDVPQDVTAAEMVDYIRDAVATCCKAQCPDDPIFDLDGESVRVRAVPKKRK